MATRRLHRRRDDAGKVTETESGGVWSISKETRYMGGQEIYFAYSGGSVQVERETFFVSDSGQHMCILETTTVDSGTPVSSPTPKVRYQLDDHLGSASVELDASANLISYEEYYPYGTTSYQAKDSYLDGYPKRYRYSGKERDEESGLIYYGARYLAPWLCRWTSPDPGGTIDGLNLWNFVNGDPIGSVDVGGMNGLSVENMQGNRDVGLIVDFSFNALGFEYSATTSVGPTSETVERATRRLTAAALESHVLAETEFVQQMQITIDHFASGSWERYDFVDAPFGLQYLATIAQLAAGANEIEYFAFFDSGLVATAGAWTASPGTHAETMYRMSVGTQALSRREGSQVGTAIGAIASLFQSAEIAGDTDISIGVAYEGSIAMTVSDELEVFPLSEELGTAAHEGSHHLFQDDIHGSDHGVFASFATGLTAEYAARHPRHHALAYIVEALDAANLRVDYENTIPPGLVESLVAGAAGVSFAAIVANDLQLSETDVNPQVVRESRAAVEAFVADLAPAVATFDPLCVTIRAREVFLSHGRP